MIPMPAQAPVLMEAPPRRMRVYLIHPPFHYFPGRLGGRINYVRPPLGLCYLAGYLREKLPVEVAILDAMSLDLSVDEILRRVKAFAPDLVGLTVTTPTVGVTREILTRIQAELPEVTRVVGGPHITPLPTDMLDIAHVAVRGEGEVTLTEIVEAAEGKREWETIPGIAYRNHEGRDTLTAHRPLIPDLDELPNPARDLVLDVEYSHIYPSSKHSRQRFTTLFTARGCAFDCHFCGNRTLWGRQVRFRSLDRVFAEIEELVTKYDIHFMFVDDDDFSTHQKRLRQFCEGLIERNLDMDWVCHSRVDVLPEDLLHVMRRAGCVEIQVGLESGSDETLEAYNKRLTVKKMIDGAQKMRNAGINLWGTFIIGGPGETPAMVRQTIEVACKLPLTYCTFIFLLPFPGTELYRQYSQLGYLKTYDWSKYSWHGDPIFETEHLNRETLLELRREAFRKFYLRPSVLWRTLRDTVKTGSYRRMMYNLLIWLRFAFMPSKRKDPIEVHRGEPVQEILPPHVSRRAQFRASVATSAERTG